MCYQLTIFRKSRRDLVKFFCSVLFVLTRPFFRENFAMTKSAFTGKNVKIHRGNIDTGID